MNNINMLHENIFIEIASIQYLTVIFGLRHKAFQISSIGYHILYQATLSSISFRKKIPLKDIPDEWSCRVC